ncbi:hypothetical protein PV326_014468, partial [Microctonus aethiopoides]
MDALCDSSSQFSELVSEIQSEYYQPSNRDVINEQSQTHSTLRFTLVIQVLDK